MSVLRWLWVIPWFLIVRALLMAAPEWVWRLWKGRRCLRLDGRTMTPRAQGYLDLNRLVTPPAEKWTVGFLRTSYDKGARLFDGPKVGVASVRDVDLPLDGRSLQGRLYDATGGDYAKPGLVYFHGGGFVIGSLTSHDHLCRKLARMSGMRVLAVAYRLGPEHPLPAARDDAGDVWEWVQAHAAELGMDPARIAVAGDSAGAALAVMTADRAAARPDGGRPTALGLIYPPYFSATETASRRLLNDHPVLLNGDLLGWFEKHMLAPGDLMSNHRMDTELRPDAIGPTWILTCGFDPLRDEGGQLADRLTAAGVPVALRELPGLFHGFITLSAVFREADESLRDMAHFLVAHNAARTNAGAAPQADG